MAFQNPAILRAGIPQGLPAHTPGLLHVRTIIVANVQDALFLSQLLPGNLKEPAPVFRLPVFAGNEQPSRSAVSGLF